MLSHPMFLRSTIHLGLVGEMHMHTGKNTPTLQDGEKKKKKKEDSDERMPGQSGFLPPRDLVLAEELQAAASGSGQLRQQQLRGRGRSSRVPGAHDRSPCLRRV